MLGEARVLRASLAAAEEENARLRAALAGPPGLGR